MLHNGLGAAALVGLAWLAVAGQQPSRPFTAEANLVVVPTVVVDKKGATVPGLTASDFQVFEDGRRVPIESFVPAEVEPQGGRFIVLVLDNLNTRAELGFRVRDIAKHFTERMGPGDSVVVIPLNGGRAFNSTGKASALVAIERFKPSFGDTVRTPAENAAQGLQAIATLSHQLAALPHRRKVLVFIGAAAMFSPREDWMVEGGERTLHPLWAEAVRSTGRDNLSVYVIDPEGHGGVVQDYGQSFAVETGGAAWINTNNFNRAVERIWHESGSYYLLGYTTPVNDHRIHKIEVRVATPGVTVRARRARG